VSALGEQAIVVSPVRLAAGLSLQRGNTMAAKKKAAKKKTVKKKAKKKR
jgi:hypothetical protein